MRSRTLLARRLTQCLTHRLTNILLFSFAAAIFTAPASSVEGSIDSNASAAALHAAEFDLPPSSFATVPGWLGMTVQPVDTRQHGWTPSHPNATAVILNADPWSETVEEGTRFRLLAAEGNLPLTLSEVSQIPYGCDGTPTTMAAFRTPHDLAEQLVWILPDGNRTAASVPVAAGASSEHERSWSAGPLTATVRKTGAHTGTLHVRAPSGPDLVRDFDNTAIMSGEPAGLDITDDNALAMPVPAAAFRLDPETFLLVLRSLSGEGLNLEVLMLRGNVLDSAGEEYVYLCAY